MRDTTSDVRLKTRTWVLLVVLAGLSGGFAGVVAATLGGAGDSGRASAGEESLAAAVRQLATQMTALQAVLAQPPLPAPGSRSPAAADAASVAPAAADPAPLVARPDLESVLQSLIASLREGTAGGQATPPLVVPPPDPSRRERVFKLVDQDNTDNTRAHLFWSEQAVLDAYGQPDSIEVTIEGERWQYQRSPGHGVQMLVHDGRVIRVSAW